MLLAKVRSTDQGYGVMFPIPTEFVHILVRVLLRIWEGPTNFLSFILLVHGRDMQAGGAFG